MTALHTGVRDWIRTAIAGVAATPLPRVDDAAKLEAIGVDAIAQHRLAIEAEDAFGITIGPEELEEAKTVGDLLALIERKRTEVAA